MRFLARTARRLLIGLLIALAVFLGVRAYDSQRGAPLELWHTHEPHELTAEELDRTDWAGWMKAEDAVFAEVAREVVRHPPAGRQPALNRYDAASPVHPGRFAQDWNRSYELAPQGKPVGAAVFLHGLTDSPYSLRHIARAYRDRGFLTVAIRLPGHGTVPAGLVAADWKLWMAATRLAVREAREKVGPGVPLHIVGFSNGGALAMKYALDAADDPKLARVDRLVLISPMIGITRFARFAGIAGWPAFFPAFAKAAWLGVVPEFNPFKYNSFPVNAARESWRLTQALQAQILAHTRAGLIEGLPPALTFQSVLDFTVSTPAVISALYAHLPDNGSALVLFDINRTASLGPLLRPTTDTAIARLLPPAPRRFATTILANAGPQDERMLARTTPAGSTEETTRALDLLYPSDVFSLSHVALPFPLTDSLYGAKPDTSEDFGAHFGAVAARGERGALILNLDSLLRMSSNPFFGYMLDRIVQDIPERSQ